MPDFCSCGAQLPPDALFCHKCGKPQREIVAAVPEIEEVEAPPQPAVSVRPPAIDILPLNFRNGAAVRIALVVALTATVAFFIMPFLNWVFGGFFAVFFYRRRTGFLLNLGAGMRMGWITGVLAFLLYTIPFAIQIPQMGALLEERLKSMPSQDPVLVHQMMQFFQSGAGFAVAVVFSLMAMFLIITFLSMAGGALAAKVVGRG
jgi:hypothetical protein